MGDLAAFCINFNGYIGSLLASKVLIIFLINKFANSHKGAIFGILPRYFNLNKI